MERNTDQNSWSAFSTVLAVITWSSQVLKWFLRPENMVTTKSNGAGTTGTQACTGIVIQPTLSARLSKSLNIRRETQNAEIHCHWTKRTETRWSSRVCRVWWVWTQKHLGIKFPFRDSFWKGLSNLGVENVAAPSKYSGQSIHGSNVGGVIWWIKLYYHLEKNGQI